MKIHKSMGRLALSGKKGIRDVLHTYRTIISEEWILAKWYDREQNWGDSINPTVIEHLSGKKPIHSDTIPNPYNRPVYMAIGSIIESCNDKNTIIWGSGLISEKGKPLVKPRKICAVRGPRTREMLMNGGVDCPKVYGDPALLFPKIYRPEVEKKYKLGLIPHYVDSASPLIKRHRDNPEIKIIDVRGDIFDFVNDVCSCKSIASSSLHGLIAADAYGIPSLWMKLSDDVIGGNFKFNDYYESIGVMNALPVSTSSLGDVDEIVSLCTKKPMNLDISELIDACPLLPGNNN